MVAPVPIPDLTLQASAGRDNKLFDFGAESRAGSDGRIGNTVVGGLTINSNWIMIVVVGFVATTALIVFRGKK